MRDNVPCEFPAGYDGTALLKRLEQVLDPELDESILDLGFVRSLQLCSGHASVALRLPTSWCAVNFAYLMAEDVRRALLRVEGVHQVTVSLGDHCAAEEIEAAVNEGLPFAEAFPGEGAGSLAALRLTFLRKGFLGRQERLLRDLRAVGCTAATICALRIGRELAALFGPPRRTRPRLQPRRTADYRPRRQAVFCGPAASPLRGCPYRARRARGQWFILSCLTARASPRGR
jgi:metal-sulfur cluster biosynthetic enzyme